MPNPRKTCFVIMPFGKKTEVGGQEINFDDVYEYLIKPPLEKLKVDVTRCDKLPNAGSVHRDMIEHVLRDDLAVVDITTLNPNVFYELGVRHALRRSATLLLRKKGTQSPFNIQGMRTIEYDLDIRSASLAQAQIEQAAKHAFAGSANDSLVYEIFPELSVTLPGA